VSGEERRNDSKDIEKSDKYAAMQNTKPGLDLTGVRGVEPPSSQCQPTQLIGNFDPGGSDYSGF